MIQGLVEGRPITGEVVSLRPRSDAPFVFDVKTELEPPKSHAGAEGPSQVATDSYREGWDKIWGRKRARTLN